MIGDYTFINADCMDVMSLMQTDSVDFTLTDIPYAEVNRSSSGLRKLDKANADILTFELTPFLEEVLRVTKNAVAIFCGREQFSKICEFFSTQKGTVRPLIWEKSNPSPMNGERVYLSGVELGVWFKKRGAKNFNAHCKNSVFKHPNGLSEFHPTEKNHKLLEELILDNTNEGDLVFDPCAGSGSTCLVASRLNRRFKGIELDREFYLKALDRLEREGTLWSISMR